jgi:hypothetical protein
VFNVDATRWLSAPQEIEMSEIKKIHVMPIIEDECMPHGDIEECWCEPELIYKDSESGNEVFLHRELQ